VINQLAAYDALFTADDGTPTVWLVRYIDTNGKRRLFASLPHGARVPTALGLHKYSPGWQVIALCGD
jgi:pyruvate dehydrogenase (quinone)